MDLGCGDGRVVFEVSRRFGCRGVGYELNKSLVRVANQKRRRNEREMITFVHADIADVRLQDATVVYLYMPYDAVNHIAEHVLPRSGIRDGTLVVINGCCIAESARANMHPIATRSHCCYKWQRASVEIASPSRRRASSSPRKNVSTKQPKAASFI